jgi:hypothetical protein
MCPPGLDFKAGASPAAGFSNSRQGGQKYLPLIPHFQLSRCLTFG